MSIFSPGHPVIGMTRMERLGSPLPTLDAGEEDTPNDFARLVQIARSNEPLFEALQALSRRLHTARAYLAETGCNVSLGTAYYRYWRAKHSGVLSLLRANRLEARRLLGRLDPGTIERLRASDSFASRKRPPR